MTEPNRIRNVAKRKKYTGCSDISLGAAPPLSLWQRQVKMTNEPTSGNATLTVQATLKKTIKKQLSQLKRCEAAEV